MPDPAPHTTEPEPLDTVVCTLINPTPGRLEATGPHGARLELHLANPITGPQRIHRVDITLPAGTGPDALTATPETTRLEPATPVPWTLTHHGDGACTLTPAAPLHLKAGNPLALALTGLTPACSAGTAVVTTRVDLGGHDQPAQRATTTHHLSWNDDPWIPSFGPDRLSITTTQNVTLSWKGKEKQQDRPLYRLYYAAGTPSPPPPGGQLLDAPTPIDVIASGYMDDSGDGRCTFTGLTRTTAFMLQASRVIGNVLYEQTAIAAVVVEKPNLTVGQLTCSGTVALMGTARTLLSRQEKQTVFGPTTYTPTTDGMFQITVECPDSREPVDVAVSVDDTTGASLYNLDTRAEDPQAPENLTVPAPAGTQITIGINGNEEFPAQITWYPLGNGQTNTTPATRT
ncbi:MULTISPECIES: hypothetical protein [unclassified Streptomyces]|uniref:hypothetical protein n=1 Tax=unclassified Streptomyces TaxID=2593676 RepID=UPI0037151F00